MNDRADLGQLELRAGLEEGVALSLEQRQVGVHPGARVVGQRLRHERRVDALAQRDLLHHVPERHDVVGRRECVGVPQVDLLLAGRSLVVAELHRDAHRLEHRDRVAPEVVADAVRDVVEEAALVDRRGRLAAGLVPEQEELDLGVGVEGEAQVGGLGEGALEHLARVGVRRRAVRQHDVAEHPRRARRLGPPGQDLERSGVGLGEHVRLGDPREALDGRPVEADTFIKGPFELGRGHRDRLEEPEHVGEPQTHEADVALLEGAEDELLLLVHVGDRAVPVLPACYAPRPGARSAWPEADHQRCIGRQTSFAESTASHGTSMSEQRR